MSKAFTNDDVVVPEALPPLPVGRRPTTQLGFARLRAAHRQLLEQELPQLVGAAAAGNLDVRARLQIVQRRLQHLERQLALSDVAPAIVGLPATVVLGTRVAVHDEDAEQGSAPLIYVLVGPDEVDVAQRRVSYASPVGQALMGRKVGDRTFIKRPAGILEVRILSIEADAGAGA